MGMEIVPLSVNLMLNNVVTLVRMEMIVKKNVKFDITLQTHTHTHTHQQQKIASMRHNGSRESQQEPQ
jgi:hypothetical protein